MENIRQSLLNDHFDAILDRKAYNRLWYGLVHDKGSVKYWSDEDLDNLSELERSFNALSPVEQTELDKIIRSFNARRKRLKFRLQSMVDDGQCYFITLTFNNDLLKKTDSATRRKYVTRFLKLVSPCYVANIDFGSKNGREHYHAVIRSDQLNDLVYKHYKKFGWACCKCDQFAAWTYGFYTIKKVAAEDRDINKLATYLSKLTNHAIKALGARSYMIYSKNNENKGESADIDDLPF